MKKKVFLIVFIVLVVLLLVANIVVSKTATKVVNTTVAEQLKKDLGLDLKVDSVKVNVLGGSVDIKGIKAGSPPVFDEETALNVGGCKLDLGVLSLLGGVVKVSEATVEDANITLARIKGSKMNIPLPIGKPSSSPEKDGGKNETPVSETPPKERVKSEPIDLPKISANNISIETILNYVDYDLGDEPVRLGLNVTAKADGIKTYGDIGPEAGWGTFEIKTSLKDNPEKFVSEIKGRLAPVLDPMTASFDVDATIKYIDLRDMQGVADELGVTTSDLSMEAHLKCRDGVFDRINSTVKIVCLNPRPAGKHKDKAKYMSKIEKIEIPLNVGGTLEKIDVGDWEQILINALVSNLSNVAGPLLEALNEEASKVDSEKVEGTINEGLRKIGLDKLF